MKNKNFENAFDALLGFFASLPKSTLKMINPNKYVLMLKTASDLTNLLKENTESGEVNIEVDETFNSGYVSVQRRLWEHLHSSQLMGVARLQ